MGSSIPLDLRKAMANDRYYQTCAKFDQLGHRCGGRITWEHALYFAGKKLQSKFAIVPLCAAAHGVDQYQDGGDMKKEHNVWIALNQATDDELRSISKVENYLRKRELLNEKYGRYVHKVPAPVAAADQAPKFWYPLSEKEQTIVKEAILYHWKNEGQKYTPFQMIQQMIVDYGQSIERLRTEFAPLAK